MTKTVTLDDINYYNAIAALSVLSGSMSSRLFTEVREKRGLCYAVGAKYHALKNMAGIACYTGTTPDKAQEAIDVIIAEFNRLADGISENEIQKAKVGLKSSLIMQSESSSSRASGIAADYYTLSRVRSLEEIKEKIGQITVNSVLEFLRNYRFTDFTVTTIGPRPIKI
jgi:predicted Zn-dependent peptidase